MRDPSSVSPRSIGEAFRAEPAATPRAQLQKDGFEFNLNGHGPRGAARMVRTARDAIQVPSDPVIVAIAEKNLCHLGLNQDAQCFSLTNVYGMTVDVPYGASVADWEDAAAKLLQGAMDVE